MFPEYEQRWRDYFAPMLQVQTYLNLAYLALTFPLGILYFSLLIAGWATGISLLLILIGIPILALVIEGTEWMLRFERLLSNLLLGTDIPIIARRQPETGWIDRIRQHLTSGLFWRGQAYLFAKFAFGIVALIILSLAWSVPAGLIFGPMSEAQVTFGTVTWTSTPAPVALAIALFGLLLVPFSARVSNWLIDWWRVFTINMLAEQVSDLTQVESKAKRVQVMMTGFDEFSWDDPILAYQEDEPDHDYAEKPKRQKHHKTLAELLGEAEVMAEAEKDHISGR